MYTLRNDEITANIWKSEWIIFSNPLMRRRVLFPFFLTMIFAIEVWLTRYRDLVTNFVSKILNDLKTKNFSRRDDVIDGEG